MASLKRCFSQDKVTSFFKVIRANILEQAVLNLTGAEKKSNVDEAVKMFIRKTFVSKNILISFLVRILIDLVPKITQSMFDILVLQKEGDEV